ncbi:hypothetical protein CJ030_MR4G009597 [Morella rubra]|uniref:Uncharacterized protein n=1 Tax=Morella rubra TaxID=262757 RepID=A0A6A1VVX5_9ROSI|nr:hypothetical protein CJ030_MR4G009597 [Morella rubra]
MVKRKLPIVKKSKPTNVPHKKKTRAFDPIRFMDTRATEMFHTRLQKQSMIVEREVQLSKLHHLDIASVVTSRGLEPFLTDFSNLVPLELLVREFYLNFYDIDKAFRSFSVFVSGQRLQVSPDIIAQVFSAIGAKTLKQSRAYLQRIAETPTAHANPSSQPPSSIPSSSVRPSSDPATSVPPPSVSP